MNRRTLLLAALVLVSVAIPVVALAAGASDIAEIRRATATYHELQVALDDGFVPLEFATSGQYLLHLGAPYPLPSSTTRRR